MLSDYAKMNPGRNAPCHCGSGKKFKRCCGADDTQPLSNGAGLAQRRHDAGVRKINSRPSIQREKEAERVYQQANAFVAQGKMNRAVSCYEEALSIMPDYLEACSNMGNALVALGRVDQAITCFERALSIRPNSQVHFNLANALEKQGRIDLAVTYYEQALLLKPDYAEAHNNLASLTSRSHGLIQAISHYEQAITLQSDFHQAHNNLALALQAQGNIKQALVHFSHALRLCPDFVAGYDNLLFALNYASDKDPLTVYTAHLDAARQREAIVTRLAPLQKNNAAPGKRLRIGYVSSDFRQHSVSHFIEPVLEHHDHDKFEIFCYYNHHVEDEATIRLKSLAEHWRNILRMPDESASNQIRSDQIDILVDLNGHTAKNRLQVFAHKPAPIQITWLGYPNTTGLSAIDYRITDELADPVGMTDRFHSESLVRLPGSFSCYKPPSYAPEVAGLPARKNGYITFGSFNKLAKITPEVMAVWARLLLAVPGSHLFLKTTALIEKAMQQRVLAMFADFGVAPERLILHGPDQSQKAHLEKYHEVDIGLDPFPYNGTTTTCEALWMGVPVVTLAGKTHVSRVGLSQMTNLGLAEFISQTVEEYIETAARMSSGLDYLEALRKGLRPRMAESPLMNAPLFAKNLERTYQNLWDSWIVN